MTSKVSRLQSAHWRGKAAAGTLLGFIIAIAVSGLFAWLGPGGIHAGSGKFQLVMWLVAPVWLAVLSTVFLFRDSYRAWLWLGLMAAACSGALWAVSTAAGGS